jgi:hypothetical protein
MRHVFWLVLLCGCSLMGVGRASLGVTGSTDGTLGLAASFELGGGYIDTPHEITPATKRQGEVLAMFAGGGVTTAGTHIETGARAEWVMVSGHRSHRLGMRNGVVARQGGPALLTLDAAYVTSWPLAWKPRRTHQLGLELRAGPALAIDDGPDGRSNASWHAMRFYAGVVHELYAIRAHRYDPVDALIGDPKGTN